MFHDHRGNILFGNPVRRENNNNKPIIAITSAHISSGGETKKKKKKNQDSEDSNNIIITKRLESIVAKFEEKCAAMVDKKHKDMLNVATAEMEKLKIKLDGVMNENMKRSEAFWKHVGKFSNSTSKAIPTMLELAMGKTYDNDDEKSDDEDDDESSSSSSSSSSEERSVSPTPRRAKIMVEPLLLLSKPLKPLLQKPPSLKPSSNKKKKPSTAKKEEPTIIVPPVKEAKVVKRRARSQTRKTPTAKKEEPTIIVVPTVEESKVVKGRARSQSSPRKKSHSRGKSKEEDIKVVEAEGIASRLRSRSPRKVAGTGADMTCLDPDNNIGLEDDDGWGLEMSDNELEEQLATAVADDEKPSLLDNSKETTMMIINDDGINRHEVIHEIIVELSELCTPTHDLLDSIWENLESIRVEGPTRTDIEDVCQRQGKLICILSELHDQVGKQAALEHRLADDIYIERAHSIEQNSHHDAND